jgi:hypothetical protein
MKLIFDPEALVEIREVAAVYEHCQPGMGLAFLDAIEVASAEIVRHPQLNKESCLQSYFAVDTEASSW